MKPCTTIRNAVLKDDICHEVDPTYLYRTGNPMIPINTFLSSLGLTLAGLTALMICIYERYTQIVSYATFTLLMGLSGVVLTFLYMVVAHIRAGIPRR